MPLVLVYRGYKLFFFSNEGMPREKINVHIRHGDNRAKFALSPEITLINSHGMNASELTELEGIVRENRSLIQEKWHEHFGS